MDSLWFVEFWWWYWSKLKKRAHVKVPYHIVWKFPSNGDEMRSTIPLNVSATVSDSKQLGHVQATAQGNASHSIEEKHVQVRRYVTNSPLCKDHTSELPSGVCTNHPPNWSSTFIEHWTIQLCPLPSTCWYLGSPLQPDDPKHRIPDRPRLFQIHKVREACAAAASEEAQCSWPICWRFVVWGCWTKTRECCHFVNKRNVINIIWKDDILCVTNFASCPPSWQ